MEDVEGQREREQPGDHQPRGAEDVPRVAVLNQAQSPPQCLGPPWRWWEGGVLAAGVLKHDLAPDAWASLERTESSQAGAGATEDTRCQGHPHTCQEHKHGSCEAAQGCQDHFCV